MNSSGAEHCLHNVELAHSQQSLGNEHECTWILNDCFIECFVPSDILGVLSNRFQAPVVHENDCAIGESFWYGAEFLAYVDLYVRMEEDWAGGMDSGMWFQNC